MLLSYHGASTLGKRLRRPVMNRMASFEGTSSLADDAMRSTLTMLQRGRPLLGLSNRPSPPFNKTWQPTHGLVFRPSPTFGSPRSMSEAGIPEDDSSTKNPDPVSQVPEEITKVEIPKPQDPAQNDRPISIGAYNMKEELFRAAKEAAPLSMESYWSHGLYRGPLEEQEPKIKVHYCISKETTERIIQKHFMDQKVIGFDIEWKMEATKNSGPKKNVSLIQIASEERVALFQIALYQGDDLVAPSLKKILEDPEISKVGVSIKADCTRVRKYLGIDSRGLFELSHLYRLVKFSESKDFKAINKRLVSLATQVQEHLHLPMFKGEVRSSDWSQKLNLDQIRYAAADSYAGYRLYHILEAKRNALDPKPPRPYHADLNMLIRVAEGVEIVVDEATEELDPEDGQISTPLKTKAAIAETPNYLGMEVESENPEDPDAEFVPSQEIPTTTLPPKTHSTSTPKPKPKAPQPPKSPLLIAAEELATAYRAKTDTSTSPHRATAANLRAYYIWYHNPLLSVDEIAGVLRSPPLQTKTVASYILEALKLEGLEYESERVREVLIVWKGEGEQKGMMAKRYLKLEKDVGWVDGSK